MTTTKTHRTASAAATRTLRGATHNHNHIAERGASVPGEHLRELGGIAFACDNITKCTMSNVDKNGGGHSGFGRAGDKGLNEL
jgi:hypothetical protein